MSIPASSASRSGQTRRTAEGRAAAGRHIGFCRCFRRAIPSQCHCDTAIVRPWCDEPGLARARVSPEPEPSFGAHRGHLSDPIGQLFCAPGHHHRVRSMCPKTHHAHSGYVRRSCCTTGSTQVHCSQDCLGSGFKCDTFGPTGIGCCHGQTTCARSEQGVRVSMRSLQSQMRSTFQLTG